MPAFEKHKVSPPDFYDQRKIEFAVGDSVRVRVGNTHVFRNTIILVIPAKTMTIRYEGNTDTIDMLLASVKQSGPDGEFANELSGLGGCSSGSSSKVHKLTKTTTKADQLHDWVIDKVTRLIVKPNVGPITPVASRMFMVYESNFFIGEDWVPQEEEEIGLLESLNDELVCDVCPCAHLKFLRDLFHATPSECLMMRMLGRLEPVCLGETVEERRRFTRTMSKRRLPWCPTQLFLLLLLLLLVSTCSLLALSAH
jgi:hypothetical protein